MQEDQKRDLKNLSTESLIKSFQIELDSCLNDLAFYKEKSELLKIAIEKLKK